MSLVKKLTFIAPVFLVLTSIASAVEGIQPLPDNPLTVSGLFVVVNKVLNIFFTAMIILAIWFILNAGLKYITSAGDKTKTAEANAQILYAAIGIGIALFAKGIESLVRNFAGV